MNKSIKRTIIIFVFSVIWILFLFQNELAFYGIYTLISYRLHEIASIIPFICLIITFIWTVLMIKRMICKKTDKSDKRFTVLLAILLFMQIGYFHIQSQKVSVTMIVTVQSIDSQNGTITVTNAHGEEKRQIVLTAPDLLINMAQVGNQKYVALYDTNKKTPDEGKLCQLVLM